MTKFAEDMSQEEADILKAVTALLDVVVSNDALLRNLVSFKMSLKRGPADIIAKLMHEREATDEAA